MNGLNVCCLNFNTETSRSLGSVLYLSKEWRRICFFGMIYAAVSEIRWWGGAEMFCCIMQSHDLLAEGEGEGVCRCSDLVLCLHMSHVFCIGVIDGHHPVAYPNTGLSCLPTWGQLEKQPKNKGTEVRGA